MDDDLDRRAYAEFERLLDADPGARDAAMAELTAADPELARRVAALLEADRRAEALQHRGQPPSPDDAAEQELVIGTRIGPYELLQPLGRGGMGEVWLARRDGGTAVALKLLHPHLARPALRARFEREGAILASLDHPNVARLLDAGTAAGRPWLALEFVEGERIDRWCDARLLGVRARVQLFLQVCAAVAHAHQHLVVHRDLKPSNILVSADGAVKLLDFGIAKLLEVDRAEGPESELTRLGGRALTPEYAAPEQVSGQAVTTATDVYALGVLLFALLGGRHPYVDARSTPERMQRATLETEPDPLSRLDPATAGGIAAEEIARRRGTSVRELRRDLRGDLDTIVAKALRKDPAQRFPTVPAFADDLERWLAGLPVQARPDHPLYRLRKFAARNRVAVVSAALLLLTAVLGLSGILWQARIAREQARLAEVEARKATAVRDFLVGIFEQNSIAHPDGAAARQATAEQLLALGATKIRSALADAPEERAELLGTLGTLYSNLYMKDEALSLLRERLDAQRTLAAGAPTAPLVTAWVDVGDAQFESGAPDDAVKSFGEALDVCAKVADCPVLDHARALARRGYVQLNRTPAEDPGVENDYRAALALLERAPASQQRENLISDAYNGLANKAHRRNDDATAEADLRLAVQRESDAVVSAGAHQSLGDILRLRQRPAEAEPELRRAVEMYRRSAGPDHPFTANAERSLAALLAGTGRRAEAAELAAAALARSERFRGEDNLEFTAMVRHDLANIRYQRGEFEEAKRLLARDEALCRAAAYANNNCAPWMMLYARVLIATGQLDPAASILATARGKLGTIYGETSPRYAVVPMTEAALAAARGRNAEAESTLRAVLKSWPGKPDAPSPSAALATIALTELLAGTGRADEAIALARPQLDRIDKQGAGATPPDVDAGTRLWLGIALLTAGRAGDAEPLLMKAVEQRIALDDADSPWLARARVALARTEAALGRREQALALEAAANQAIARHSELADGLRHPLQATPHPR